ncbi:MAG: hypothetical protein MZV64_31765 [Ignavibacteriales bacterium]|nr:hypothetical protein [Ignavibacteriales bacterium]
MNWLHWPSSAASGAWPAPSSPWRCHDSLQRRRWGFSSSRPTRPTRLS